MTAKAADAGAACDGLAQDGDIRRGCSQATDPVRAAREFHDAVVQPSGTGLVVFFCSPGLALPALADEIARLFGQIRVIGCTTAGEIGPHGYVDGALTGFSLPAGSFWAASELILGLSEFQMSAGHAAAEAVMASLAQCKLVPVEPGATFAMLLSDGMSTNEEALVASLSGRMGNVPLLGGSAGDDLRLEQTFVYHDGKFHPDAALLTLIHTTRPFRIYRCQHFHGSDTRMVVTAADPASRTVREINAEPAAAEYARIIGLNTASLTPALFAEFPVMVRVAGDYYVRSIQRMNDDASLTFFCAIDEGVVLTLARHEDIVANLETFFSKVRAEIGEPSLVIGFDCILRSLEAEKHQTKFHLSRILAANNVIGFCTYGEQFGAMHVNQTFTAVVIG
jgi:hypothetical protein